MGSSAASPAIQVVFVESVAISLALHGAGHGADELSQSRYILDRESRIVARGVSHALVTDFDVLRTLLGR